MVSLSNIFKAFSCFDRQRDKCHFLISYYFFLEIFYYVEQKGMEMNIQIENAGKFYYSIYAYYVALLAK